MRAAVVFFLCLFFLLLKGNSHVLAGGHSKGIGSPAVLHIEKGRTANFGNVNPVFSIIKGDSLNEKRDDLISVEDEDLVISRKYVLLVRYFVTAGYASVLIYFYNYLKNRLPFCKHFSYSSSYKYILQRVLRI